VQDFSPNEGFTRKFSALGSVSTFSLYHNAPKAGTPAKSSYMQIKKKPPSCKRNDRKTITIACLGGPCLGAKISLKQHLLLHKELSQK
jgi:hypothetical protein